MIEAGNGFCSLPEESVSLDDSQTDVAAAACFGCRQGSNARGCFAVFSYCNPVASVRTCLGTERWGRDLLVFVWEAIYAVVYTEEHFFTAWFKRR